MRKFFVSYMHHGREGAVEYRFSTIDVDGCSVEALKLFIQRLGEKYNYESSKLIITAYNEI